MKHLSVKKVSERYETSPATIWRWVREGNFPRPVKLTPGCTRWRLTDLESWESSREVSA